LEKGEEIPPNLDVHIHPRELEYLRNLIIDFELRQISESVVRITHERPLNKKEHLYRVCETNRPRLWRKRIQELESGKVPFSPSKKLRSKLSDKEEEVKEKMRRSAFRIVFDQALKLESETSWVDGFTLRRINECKDIL